MDSRIDLQLFVDFSRKLGPILESELACGNAIQEVLRHNPEPGSITVVLSYRFLEGQPDWRNVEYKVLKEPHGWQASYSDLESRHVLACLPALRPAEEFPPPFTRPWLRDRMALVAAALIAFFAIGIPLVALAMLADYWFGWRGKR